MLGKIIPSQRVNNAIAWSMRADTCYPKSSPLGPPWSPACSMSEAWLSSVRGEADQPRSAQWGNSEYRSWGDGEVGTAFLTDLIS